MSPPSVLAGEHAVMNFLDSQMNLDIMSYLTRGLSFRKIAHKIGKKHSHIQTRSDFLNKHSMMTFGRWNIDVQALGIVPERLPGRSVAERCANLEAQAFCWHMHSGRCRKSS